MLIDNPIILKELNQAAHRKRTYLVRAGLSAVAAALMAPPVASTLEWHGQD